MARKKTKDSPSQYFGVSIIRNSMKSANSKNLWRASVRTPTDRLFSLHRTEREAAIAVDKFLIRHGLEPKNILKRKVNNE